MRGRAGWDRSHNTVVPSNLAMAATSPMGENASVALFPVIRPPNRLGAAGRLTSQSTNAFWFLDLGSLSRVARRWRPGENTTGDLPARGEPRRRGRVGAAMSQSTTESSLPTTSTPLSGEKAIESIW